MDTQSNRAVFQAQCLEGLYHVAAKDTSRPVLTTVCLDARGYLVAADGFALVARKPFHKIEFTDSPFTALIPSEFAKLRFKKDSLIIVDAMAKTVQGTTKAGQTVTHPLADGTFPRWDNLVPVYTPNTKRSPITLSVHELQCVSKALGDPPVLYLFSSAPRDLAVAYLDCDSYAALALIMPMLAGERDAAGIMAQRDEFFAGATKPQEVAI